MNFVIAALLGVISAQQVGTLKKEFHPKLSLSKCSKGSGCQQTEKSITMDANWRWYHEKVGYANCFDNDAWVTKDCPDPESCIKNCSIEGIEESEWKATYGVKSEGDTLDLGFLTKGQYSTNVGSRTYMMDSDEQYEMFKLKNREFTIDVDVSNLPCGLNGALYFVEMDADGGKSKFSANEAGAKYGTGYCDAQCPHDIKFQEGEANTENFKKGNGKWGACCAELDIWEANKIASAFTVHPCNIDSGMQRCTGTDCGDNATQERYKGVCDKDGCDLNPFRAGVTDFYGPGPNFKVDTTKKFTVVTQFITTDGTDNGDLKEMRRIFVQDGKVIPHPMTNIPGASKQYDSITDEMCVDQKKIFGDENDFAKKGAMKNMGAAMDRGLVLVMSIWDDHDADMLWLDSTYPKHKTTPGGPRGSCPITSGDPDQVERDSPDSNVKYSNIRVGEIGSTFQHNPTLQELIQNTYVLFLQ